MTNPEITQCFRLASEKWCGQPGHYKLIPGMLPLQQALAMTQILGITYVLVHGKDSFLPGVKAGFDPKDLVPCGCGKWEEAGEPEQKLGKERLTYFAMFIILNVPVNSNMNFFCVN